MSDEPLTISTVRVVVLAPFTKERMPCNDVLLGENQNDTYPRWEGIQLQRTSTSTLRTEVHIVNNLSVIVNFKYLACVSRQFFDTEAGEF